MSLPPGFLDELRSRLSLGQVVGRKVMWDTRKSNQGKGDLWAPCPFHQEKSASFHVDDRKGFYYCFGCHAKGDAITFVRETENVDFMEAVRILAGEAGLPMPERDPQAQQKTDHRSALVAVMEQAVQFHKMQLQTGAAAQAREYLEHRGLNPEAQARWDIGFAPAQGGVLEYLTGKGVAEKLIVDAGLAAQSDRGSGLYNRFRDRIMFPIRDGRGRPIGFGGRAMDPNHPAKYYNSPETDLFDKGRSLYNQGPAREAAGKGKPLIVAEGYMDVIALSEAGFAATVAPLGTAITDNQLHLLWRIADEPIIALDGDTAGLRAAMRVIDIALPLLEAGKSLRFALMPEGLDPDDLIKTQGASAMQKLLDGAIPMVRMLWDRELEAAPASTPEQRAGLDLRLRMAIGKIQNQDVKRYYAEAIKELRWITFRPNYYAPANRFDRRKAPGGPLASTKASALVNDPNGRSIEALRERVILALCVRHAQMRSEFEAALENFEFLEPDHQELALRLIDVALSHGDDEILMYLGKFGLESVVSKIFNDPMVRVLPAMQRDVQFEVPRMTLAEQFAKLDAERGHRQAMEDAEFDMSGYVDEGLTHRVQLANYALNDSGGTSLEQSVEYDVSSNGLSMDRSERDALAKIVADIISNTKKPKK
ncbi:DNA primase [Yoonia tamlensis]|nr:DNA primase [Yoonia tamlensis]